jgi:hypothetical protein
MPLFSLPAQAHARSRAAVFSGACRRREAKRSGLFIYGILKGKALKRVLGTFPREKVPPPAGGKIFLLTLMLISGDNM